LKYNVIELRFDGTKIVFGIDVKNVQKRRL